MIRLRERSCNIKSQSRLFSGFFQLVRTSYDGRKRIASRNPVYFQDFFNSKMQGLMTPYVCLAVAIPFIFRIFSTTYEVVGKEIKGNVAIPFIFRIFSTSSQTRK